jgi:hypothetical protein
VALRKPQPQLGVIRCVEVTDEQRLACTSPSLPAVDVVPPHARCNALLYQVLQRSETIGMPLSLKAVEHQIDVAVPAHHYT